MKRIAIYVYHDENGLAAEYALFYLKALKKIAEKIIVVVNGSINCFELEKFKNLDLTVIERENKGWDFWGYRDGFFSVAAAELKLYDELILANSSVFGPVFPLENMFTKIKTADFWGITKHRAVGKIKEHIQTYFMVFKNRMFTSSKFFNYFKRLKKINTKKEATALEINFTEHFCKFGFTFQTFVDNSVFKHEIDNPCQYLSNILVREYGCPFVKKTVFGFRYDLAQRESGGGQTAALFEYLQNKTEYDTGLITKEIARIYSMDEIQKFLNLNWALSGKYRDYFTYPGCACLLDDASLKPYFEKLADVFEPDPKQSYLKQVRDLANKYEYILIFSPNEKYKNRYAKDLYLKHLLDCTILNKIYMMNVAGIFARNPHIGVLAPLPYIFGGFKLTQSPIDKIELKAFCGRMEFSGKLNPDFLNTIPGVFWIKKQTVNAIKDVVDFDFETKLNKGMIFSILAQKYGFLTGTIAEINTMSAFAGNLEYSGFIKDEFLDDVAAKVKRAYGKTL